MGTGSFRRTSLVVLGGIGREIYRYVGAVGGGLLAFERFMKPLMYRFPGGEAVAILLYYTRPIVRLTRVMSAKQRRQFRPNPSTDLIIKNILKKSNKKKGARPRGSQVGPRGRAGEMEMNPVSELRAHSETEKGGTPGLISMRCVCRLKYILIGLKVKGFKLIFSFKNWLA